jgi:hypothetical protein
MTDKPVSPGDLRSLWQTMPTDVVVMSAEEMRERARKFKRRIQRRNMIEYAACAIVVVAFGRYATFTEPATPLWPIANIAIIIGTLVIAFNLHRIARAGAAPQAASVADLIAFHRGELMRQRQALVSVWKWYLLPVAPGLLLWFAAVIVGRPDGPDGARWISAMIFAAVLTVAMFIVIILLNLLGAARLQRMIDDLDRYKETP